MWRRADFGGNKCSLKRHVCLSYTVIVAQVMEYGERLGGTVCVQIDIVSVGVGCDDAD